MIRLHLRQAWDTHIGGRLNQETACSQPTGPWRFKAYVLDGGGNGTWDHGRFSGGSVIYSGGLFHVFYSASDTLDNKDFVQHCYLGFELTSCTARRA